MATNKAHTPGKAVVVHHAHDEHAHAPLREGDDIPQHGPAVEEPKSPGWLPFVGGALFAVVLVMWLSSPSEPTAEEAAAAAAASASAAAAAEPAAAPPEGAQPPEKPRVVFPRPGAPTIAPPGGGAPPSGHEGHGH